MEGLRGLAILLVVASHAGVLLQGGLGNAIFFPLSGFFAAAPFRDEGVEQRFLSPKGIGESYLARLVRILPVYWLTILMVHLVNGNWTWHEVIKNALFLDVEGHFWFLQQEMFFSLCLPLIMAVLWGCRRLARRACLSEHLTCAVVVLVLALISKRFLTAEVFSLRGNNQAQVVRFFQFLPGMATAYVYKSIRAYQKRRPLPGLVLGLCSVYPLAFLAFCICSSQQVLQLFWPEMVFLVGWSWPSLCSWLTCLCVLSLLLAGQSPSAKAYSSLLLRGIGKISFPLYVIHWFLIGTCPYEQQPARLTAVLTMSAGAALLAHLLVEKPANLWWHSKKWSAVRDYFQTL